MDISQLFEALDQNPTDLDTLDNLQTQLLAEGDQDGLERAYTRVLTACDTPQDVENVLRRIEARTRTVDDPDLAAWVGFYVGMMYQHRAENPVKAEMFLRKVPLVEPYRESLVRFYTQFYAERRNWRRLEQFLEESGAFGPDEATATETRRTLARLAEETDQPDKAIAYWVAVHQSAPDDTEAEARLKALYIKVQKWHSLVELLKEQLQRLPEADLEGKILVHLEMIDIFRDQIKSETKVTAAYQAILELDPGNQMALDALIAQFDAMKRYPDLVKVLQKKIEHTADTAAVITLHRQVAQIMIEKFSNSTEAIKSYEAILALDPTDRDALVVLKDVYEKRNDWEHFIEVSQREVDLLADAAERHKGYLELARMSADKIRKPAVAIALWRKVLEFEPENPQALENLLPLYEREKDFEALVDVLERKLNITEATAERIDLLDKLGLIYGVRLGNAEKTVETWKRVLALDPTHRKAQIELKKRFLDERQWDELEWFFRNYGDVAEFVRTLETQVKTLEEPADQIAILYKTAKIWREELDQTPRAVRALERVLELDPEHVQTAEILIPIYEEMGEWAKLPPVYETKLAYTEDPAERQPLLLALAAIHEEKLNDVNAAFFCYVQAFKEDWRHADVYAQLERLAESSANWDSYVVVLEETLELVDLADYRVRFQLRLAQLYETQVGDPEKALDYYLHVVGEEPNNRTAILAIERLYKAMGRFEDLIGICRRKLDLESEPEERKAILFELGATWRDALSEPEEAINVYRGMLEEFPSEVRVYDEISKLYLKLNDFGALGDVLQRKLALLQEQGASDAVIAEQLGDLGMLAYGNEGRVGAAVDWYERALALDPDNRRVVGLLEQLLADEDSRPRISAILEPVYERWMDWARLADVYEIQLAQLEREEAEAQNRVAMLKRLGEIYREPLSDDALAFRTYCRVFSIDPVDPEVRNYLEPLAESLDSWIELVELYESKVADIDDAQVKQAVLLTIAQLYDERIGDAAAAQGFYRQVLDIDPLHRPSLDALERIFRNTRKYEPLLGILERKAELAEDNAQRIHYAFEISKVYREHMGDTDKAIAAALQVLDIDPHNREALQHLDALYVESERAPDLADILLRRIDLAQDNGEIVDLKSRLAVLQESRLQDVAAAIHTWASIVELEPDRLEAVEALERLFDTPDYSGLIAPILEPYYQRRGDWERLVRVYTVEEQQTEDPEEKVLLLFQISELYETQGMDPRSAFDHYARAFALLPDNGETLDALLRLSDALVNHEELVLLIEEQVDNVLEPQRKKEIHRVAAQLFRDQCEDAEGAKRHFAAVLDLDPEDLPALNALTELYRANEQWEPLVQLLLSKAALEQDVALKCAMLHEAGELSATALADAEKAIGIYESVLQASPDDDAALGALEGLYGQVENWERLGWVYSERIARTGDLAERKVFARKKAEIQEEMQGAIEDAIDTYSHILEWDGDDADALAQLDRLYTRAEDWASLLNVLQRRLGQADGDEAKELRFRVGRLYEEKLEDVWQAIEAYAALLKSAPDHAKTLAALERIVRERDERQRAFDVLQPVLTGLQDFEKLLELYGVIAANCDDPFEKVRIHATMGAIAETQLGDPERAFEYYGAAFRLDVERPETVEELERLAQNFELFEHLALLYGEGAEQAADPDVQLRLRLKQGRILKDQIGDQEAAVAHFRAVYDDYPDNLQVLEALDSLYAASANWPALLDVLAREIDAVSELPAKIELYFRLAGVAEEHLQDRTRAFEANREVLFLDQQNPRAIQNLEGLFLEGHHRLDIAELLEPIYRQRQDWGSLLSMFEMKIEAVDDAVDRLELIKQIADINLQTLGRTPEAIGWYGKAFVLDPQDDVLLEQLDNLVAGTGQWADLVEILLQAVEASDDAERRVVLWHKAGRVLEEKLYERERAESIYLRVLDEDSENLPALQRLDGIYSELERWEDLQGVLEQEIGLAPYDDDKVLLLMRLAELRRDRLGRWDDAVAAFREVLTILDSHRPALLALSEIYATRNDWEPLFEVCGRLADVAESDDERVGYLKRQANLAELRLDNAQKAIELWEEILTLRADDGESIRELQRLREQVGDWAGLLEAFERELNMAVADSDRRVELFKSMGRVWRDRLEDGLQAQEAWRRVLDEQPEDREALDSLRTLYRESENYESLVDILERMSAVEDYDSAERVEIWEELGQLKTDVILKPQEAIQAWRQVMALDPNHRRAILSLEKLYYDEAMWEPCVDILKRRVSLEEATEDQVECLMKAARIQLENLGDPDAAAESYEAVLERQPAFMDAYYQIERIYESKGDWYRLAEVLSQKVGHLEDEVDQVYSLQNLARIFEERLGMADRAFQVLERALDIQPTDEQTLREIERVATAAEMWEPLLDIIERVVPKLAEPDQIVEYLLKAARLLRERLNRPDEAVQWLQLVVERDAENEEALRGLAALYERTENWDRMIDAMERLVSVVLDYRDRLTYQTKIAETLEYKLLAPEEAVEAYRKVLEIEEDNLPALHRLEALYGAQDAAAELVQIYERLVPLQPEREAELKLRIGELYETKLERDEDAIAIYQDLLTTNPNNREALDRLMGLLFENKDIDRLTELFEARLMVASSPAEKAELHQRLAVLYADFKGNREQAALQYRQLLDIDPDNLEAFRAIEGLYEADGRWEDLLEVLERHVTFEPSDDAKAALLLKAAFIYRDNLADIDNAIRMFERVVGQQPSHREALDALEALYRQSEQWEQAAGTLDRKLAIVADPTEAVQLRHRRGQLLLQQIGDAGRAVLEFRQAFALNPSYLPAAHDLVEALGATGAWPEQVKVLAEIVKRSELERDKAAAYCRMATVYHKQLRDIEGAVDAYERALEIIPDYADGVQALAQLYIDEGQWARAMPLLDILKNQVDPHAEPERAAVLYRQIAVVAQRMLDEDRALAFYEQADRIQPNQLVTLRGLAELYYRLSRFADARKRLQQIVDVAESEMSPDELVDTYMRLGDVCLRLGATEEAGEFLERVLLYQPNNPKAIGDLIKFMEQHEDWEGAIRYKRELQAIKADPLEKLAIHIEIGDLYKEKLDDVDNAIAAYRDALTVRPDSLAAHIKLLEIFIASKRYDAAVDTLHKLMEISPDNEKKASYALAIAVIYRDELGDTEKALDYFNRTLDLHPDRVEAFKYVDEMLTRAKDWKNQAKAYTRMIQRIRGQNKRDLEFMLYKNLGEIYRSRIRNVEYAVPAYQLAAQLRPEDPQVHEILAELYSSQNNLDKAAEEHRALLRVQPDRVESYRALKSMYLDTRQYDRAWCVTGVLVMLNQADESERQFFHQYRAPSIKVARRSLDLALWRDNVYAEGQDFLLGQIFQIMYQAVGDRLGAKDLKDVGIKKRDELNLAKQKDLMFVNVLKSVARVLGIAPPHVYLSERAVGVRIEGTLPPIMVIGADMLQGKSEAEMSFILGKFLTYFHPMHMMAGVYPLLMLKTLLICAQKFCYPNELIPGEGPEVDRVVREMGRGLSQQLQMQLVNAMEQFRRTRRDVDLNQWLQQVELTADRAGFVCCGDLEVTGRLLKMDTAAFSTLQPREKIKDIVLYAVSDKHLTLRAQLGLTVGQ